MPIRMMMAKAKKSSNNHPNDSDKSSSPDVNHTRLNIDNWKYLAGRRIYAASALCLITYFSFSIAFVPVYGVMSLLTFFFVGLSMFLILSLSG